MIDDAVKSPGELMEEIRALRAEVAALRGRGASRRDEVAADSEAWFRELADTIPQIVWTARPDGFLDYYNRRWYELGGRAGAYGDDSWTPAIHPDDVAGVLARWRSSVQTGRQMEDNAFRLRDGRSGEYRWHIGRATPVRDAAGEILRWVGTTTDVHDLKVAQADMREQRDLLARPLHDDGAGARALETRRRRGSRRLGRGARGRRAERLLVVLPAAAAGEQAQRGDHGQGEERAAAHRPEA